MSAAIPQTTSTRRSDILLAAILIALVFLAYGRVIGAGFIWDDPQYVVNNLELRDWRGLFDIWFHPMSLPQWYPLVHTTFWIEYHLWGTASATGFHIVNIALHAISCVILWRLLRQLELPGAFLAAAIFAVHPVEVESVAWVTERKNVLSLLFYLLALRAYWNVCTKPGPQGRAFALALLFFLCALFSKTVTATFPAAVLVILWWKNGHVTRRDVARMIPFFIVGIAMGAMTSWLEVHHVGADGTKISELNFSPIQRIYIAGRAAWFYAAKIIWPTNLTFIYPRWNSIDQSRAWLIIFPIAAISVAIALAGLRRKIGRAPLAAVLLLGGTLAPALGFASVYPMRFSFVADHFQYHASIALITLFASLIWQLAARFNLRWFCFLLLAPLLLLTRQQAPIYTDPLTLWTDTALKNPTSWMVFTNLGHALRDVNQDDQADAMYLRALQLAPNLQDTHANAGNVFGRLGNYERATAEFAEALRISPDFAPAYFGWGQVLEHQHKPEEAREKFLRAVEIAPHYAAANYRLATLLESDRPDDAIARYRQAIANDPNLAGAHFRLGMLLLERKEYDEALGNLFAAVRLDPTSVEAWTALGRAQLETNHSADAVRSFENALTIHPGFAPASAGLEKARSTVPH